MHGDLIRQPVIGPADLGQTFLKAIFAQTYPAGVRIKHCYASSDEQALVISRIGDVVLTVDDGSGEREIDLPEGCGVLLSEAHLRALLPQRDWTCHWYNFYYSPLDMLPRLTPFDAPPAAEMQQVFDGILPLAGANQLWARRRATALFLGMLTQILASNVSEVASTDHAYAIHRVTEFLSTRLDQVVTVEEMAEVAGMSISAFRRRFKRVMGVTYKVYYDTQRTEAAMRLLIEGCSVKQTAAQLAFSDQFHFSRTFRRVSGLTPSEVLFFHKRQREATLSEHEACVNDKSCERDAENDRNGIITQE